MENPLYIGLSRQIALRRQLEVVANNIANMNTVGFRADRMLFEAAIERAGRKSTEEVAFTIDRATYTDTQAGPMRQTGNPLDVAIDGDGWLRVDTPEGERFTRDGRMARSEAGQLVTISGHAVLDDGGLPIDLPAETAAIEISPEGRISADGAPLARIGVVRFADEQSMTRQADGLFASDQPQQAAGARIVQGMLESANVRPIVEMSRMMELTRDYQSVTKMIEEGQELLRGAISRLGRPAQGA
ncbi:flagellar basal-body rod protein FlgF [Arenibaculum pallidiluteum]|uniref:flagellar basal-body rod protein FlgF n=1 Tax=Arenibaculum pallidiluteum TaxID=2812559 RepID=UPI001A979E0B|nr:flagellar basal-body rod protein FlgF [Arenibaculum pallidiluteum]